MNRLDRQCEQLMSKANCLLGILASAQSRSVASDYKRVLLRSESLKTLQTAEKQAKGTDSNVIYHLCVENAEQRKLDTALSYVKKLLKLEAGSCTRGWILLARILSAQKKYIDAEMVVDAALEQTGKWDQAQLLRTKAKLQIAQGHTKNAIQTYAHLLAALQVQKKTFGIRNKLLNRRDQDRTLEMETWHDLINIYTSLSQWPDAEVCLSKTEVLSHHPASSCHSRGTQRRLLHQAKGLNKEAQKSFWEALDKEPTHVPSLISMAKILIQQPGDQFLHVARSLVRQAICLDRTNHLAWYTLGLLHTLEPVGTSAAEAVECFEAAALLKETAPVEPFR
ncbi:hypothetical protein Cgig2_020434 [Carnegiea gigantea]|uniref:Uncharacterized protein n=1 Tax=Carnegiea gigantea TaxID=171969 RepID=A0A9Q1JYC1_9CARY|nr:hypothetical protein Cgig2_020434 [Carnegiea gigantea]